MNWSRPKPGHARLAAAGPPSSSSLVRRLAAVGLAAATAFGLLVLAAPAAFAQPANDSFDSPTVISAVPFSTSENTSDATSDPADPFGCSNNGSVWFAYTPAADETLRADTFGSSYDTVLSAWTGTAGALNQLACNDDFNGADSQVTVAATGGTTVYFMVGFCCGNGLDGGGPLTFSVETLAPPPNDNFANATPVTALPFTDRVDLSRATTQPSEPQPCISTSDTVWYSFTPATTQSLTLRTNEFGAAVVVYTGTSLSTLTRVVCTDFGDPALLPAVAGTTYLIQVGAWCCNGFGPVTFHLEAAPNPTASFFFFPGDPSSFDNVQFQDFSSDPAGGVVTSRSWAFGDGSTGTGSFPTHRYAADGDYTAVLTVTTADGRSASTSQAVHVQTHDVAVVQVAVPNTAHVGQTIAITVYVRNTRYPETARVDLLKSVPGGFSLVGSLTQAVPVRPPGGNSTKFLYSYTVTESDQAIGKITFKAVAVLQGARDALSADNDLSSPPVRIN